MWFAAYSSIMLLSATKHVKLTAHTHFFQDPPDHSLATHNALTSSNILEHTPSWSSRIDAFERAIDSLLPYIQTTSHHAHKKHFPFIRQIKFNRTSHEIELLRSTNDDDQTRPRDSASTVWHGNCNCIPSRNALRIRCGCPRRMCVHTWTKPKLKCDQRELRLGFFKSIGIKP